MEKKYKYYEDGTTIRKVASVPERKPSETRKRQVRYDRSEEADIFVVGTISGKMALMLAILLLTSVLSCITYLGVQSDINERKEDLQNLENSITSIKTVNDSIEYDISSFIDVDYITKVAVEQLGMVRATKDQIINYESSKSEFMEQYNDVPGN